MHKPEVCWIPAPPISGSVSMGRYWRALQENLRAGDPIKVTSIIGYEDVAPREGFQAKLIRQWERRVLYPLRLRTRFSGKIAHVLDHSWADMLKHVPKTAKKVVTVHDLIPLRFPGELSGAQLRKYTSWVACIKQADLVVADSDYTREDVRRFLGINSDRILTVPLGVQIPDPGEVPAETNDRLKGLMGASGGLIIGNVGGTGKRKNLEILPEAFAAALPEIPGGLTFVRTGSRLDPQLAARFREVLGPTGLLELGHIGDSELSHFFRRMDAVVVPSLYEGFGLPVLEAMAWGTPVLSSSATSLPEVGGDAALYFDPNRTEDIARCVVEFSKLKDRTALAAKCRERAAAFSWRRCLEGLYSVYSRL